MYAYEEREGEEEREREKERMELQLGGKHIIINEAERIAAVDSHVRTGVAISALYPTSLCAIGGVSISFPDPLDDRIACTHPARNEHRRRSDLVLFVFVAINITPGSFSVNILRVGKFLQRVMNKFVNLVRLMIV